jgi:16S rRNA processing protein RimM
LSNSHLVKIAKITSAHGIKGEVKVFCYGIPENILTYQNFFLENQDNKIEISFRGQKESNFIAKIENIETRNQAESLKNQEIYIPQTDLPETDKDEFYIENLIDMDVIDKSGKKIGKITSVSNYKAGDIITIEYSNNKKADFIFSTSNFPEINQKENTITFHPPEEV